MVKRNTKSSSKRTTLRKKYKIIKKVKDHNRNLRREKKKNPKKFRRKDPGVPHSLPFKEDIYKHIDQTRELFNEIKKNQFLARIAAKKNGDKVNVTVPSKISVSLASEFKKVIKESDVIIEVLDARDPNGTRCPEAELEVAAHNKKLVLLINKIDLVPGENVLSWLKYFRRWYATLPFKANTQEQANNLKVSKDAWKNNLGLNENFKKTHAGIGVEALMALLGSYARHKVPMTKSENSKSTESTQRLVVGFIGLPNTGKSSIVNTLKRKNVTPSSNIPGLTRISQLFRLSGNLFLYDSPGMIPSNSVDEAEKVLKNCIKPEALEDPNIAVEAILRRVPKRQLMVKYSIADYASPTDFLLQFAKKRGLLKKGGVCHTRQAALTLIRDWITGRITYHTLPPEEDILSDSKHPETIAIDILDLPLHNYDQEAISRVVKPREVSDIEFCPDAVISDSKPMKVSINNKLEIQQSMDLDGDSEDEDSEEDDSEADEDQDEDFEENEMA